MTAELSASPAPPRPTRVFVALKMVPEVAQALADIAEPLTKFGIRPIAPDDIHLTLVPPWNEAAVEQAAAKLTRAAKGHSGFALEFGRVGYGPEPKHPRYLWAECAVSQPLATLRDALQLAFGQVDERLFLPHVTLARLREAGARIARKCPIDRALALTQQIATVELMQSPLPGERGYRVLASVKLAAP